MHPAGDALRYLDVALGSLLVLGLCQRWWARGRHGTLAARISLRTAILSWGLLAVADVVRDLAHLGEPTDATLPLDLLGHVVGVVYCLVAVSVEWDARRTEIGVSRGPVA